MALKLLIVEDDYSLRESIADYFGSKGWEIVEAANGEEALQKAEEVSCQLILLDVMLPKLNGFAVCRRIRENSDVPVIFITARVMEEDELNGYSLGADDYMTKPFSLLVLYAKAMSLMSRIRGKAPFRKLRRGDLESDFRTRQILVQDIPLNLAPKEYEMLLFFMENLNRVFSREQLLIRFWGYEFEGNERVVDNHIKILRKAIAHSNCKIRTFRKSGYCLVNKEQCSIENTGEHIAENDLPHVFEMFYGRQNNPVDDEKHLGLGLYLSKKICSLHHLELAIQNTEMGVMVRLSHSTVKKRLSR